MLIIRNYKFAIILKIIKAILSRVLLNIRFFIKLFVSKYSFNAFN